MLTLLERLASDALVDRAYRWLCRQRDRFPTNSDIWWLRFHWTRERPRIQAMLAAGQYRFSPLQVIREPDGETLHLWCSTDALVLKALACVLEEVLPIARSCSHVRGHGGVRGTVRAALRAMAGKGFVVKTDVYHFYESIDHAILLDRLRQVVREEAILDLIGQSLHRTVERGGEFREITRGLPRGSPLSPLLAGFLLYPLDQALEAQSGCFYRRYMDDLLVLAPTRWRLRKAIRIINRGLAAAGLAKHPEKTWIGRTERGFDFLGYRLRP